MLKAGFARIDVTPAFGTYLSGYFEARYADGILDPLQLNAIALSDGEDTALIVISDFLGIREKYATKIRKAIAARTGVALDHIMVTALHQHTSIALRDAEDNNVVADAEYMNVMYRKFADVAQMAMNDMSEATFGIADMQALKPLSFVRRYILKDGTLKTNPGKYAPEDIVGPAAEADNTVRLLRFIREGKKDIALVNFSTHPDVIGGTKFSADWPGFVRRFVEADYPNAHCLLLNGVQGDTNHINFMVSKEERFPNGRGYPHAELMGRVIADTVKQIWDKIEMQEGTKISGGMKTVYNKTRTDGEEFFDECWDVYEARAINHDYTVDKSVSGIPMAEAYRIVRMRTEAPLFQKIPVTALGLGNVAFVGFGGEPFTHYAAAVRENFPNKYIVAACCANGYQGYLPTAKAFEQGGYEAISSPFSPNLEEDCVAAATELINNF